MAYPTCSCSAIGSRGGRSILALRRVMFLALLGMVGVEALQTHLVRGVVSDGPVGAASMLQQSSRANANRISEEEDEKEENAHGYGAGGGSACTGPSCGDAD